MVSGSRFSNFPKPTLSNNIIDYLKNTIHIDDIEDTNLKIKSMIKNKIKNSYIDYSINNKIGGTGRYKNDILNYPIIIKSYNKEINNNNDFYDYIYNFILNEKKYFDWDDICKYFVDLKKNTTDSSNMKNSNNELVAKNDTLEEQLEQAQKRVEELERDNSLLQNKKSYSVSKFQREINELNKKLNDKEEKFEKLEKKYEKLEEKFEKEKEKYDKDINRREKIEDFYLEQIKELKDEKFKKLS